MNSLTARLRNSGGSLAILAGVLIFSLATLGQSNLGRILGSITDPSGSVISGATITVTDVQRGISRTLTTDQAGGYAAPNLLPGTYTVRATAQGFKAIERSGLVLQVGQDLRIDLALQVGEQSQTVTVTGEAPLVNVTNSTLGGTLNNEAINDLPLNGRNYQNLVVLRPGSLFYPGGGGWTQSTNGSRPEDNGYIVDGLTNDHPLTGLTIINGAGVEGDAATILPIDAIQEFNVIENPPAEYGWKPGAITNVGLKSGTNNVHGTAYAFGRSDGFDARNYFNPGPTNGNCVIGGSPSPASLCAKTSVDLKQWGGTVGGAIKKDKLFYFLGFEDEHYSLGNLFQRNVPESVGQATPDARHSLVDAIRGLQTAGLPISPVSLKLTGCTLGPPVTCTGGLYPKNLGTSQSVAVGYPSNFASDNGLAKIDYQINSNNTLNGMFFMSRGDITAQDPGTFAELQPYWLSHQINQPTVIDLNWTWTPNSRWVNEARFGITHMNRATNNLDSNVPASTYGLNTGVSNPVAFGFPNIIVAGLSPLGGFPGWPIKFGGTNVFQGVDNISYLRGKHTFKFGAEIHRNTVDEGRFSRGRGLIFFFGNHASPGVNTTSLEDFLSGAPTMAQVLVGTNDLHLSDWQYAAWASDDWRMTPRLTLNLGLRYEYLSVLHEDNNQLGNFDPSAGFVQVGKQVSSPYNGDHLDFAPRVGLAWDVTGKGTTVVHAGYSIVSDGGLPMFVFIGNGGAQNASTLGLGAIPTAANIVVNGVTTPGTGTIKYSTIGAGGPPLINAWRNNSATTPLFQTTTPQCGDGVGADPGPCSVLGVDRNFRTPYVSNWTLGVQHSFTNNLSLNLAYVGNHGSRLPGIVDLNQPNLTTGAFPLAAKFPYLQYVNFLSNLYTSNYNGLQATFTERVTHGLSFILGYTWSHSLDDQSFNINTPLPQDSTHPFADYGNSIYDITHRLTLSFTYNLPNKKAPAQMLEGWQLNSIVTIQTGAPWGAGDTSNNISGTSEFTDRWDFAGNAHDFQSNQNSIPYCSAAGIGADFANPGSITCAETTPGGSINLSAAQSATFAANCLKAAQGVGAVASLNSFGCFAKGGAVMIPPAAGTWGTMNRDPFRDSGFRDWDLSVTKSWKYQERLTTQFRAEFFNILNHPSFTNPYGGSNGFGDNDPSSPNVFGCGCATPDQAAGNPVLGTGGSRAMQLGLKLIF